MSSQTGWSVRHCQRLLKSLRQKGYIQGQCKNGIGSYRIKVNKYFDATPQAHLPKHATPGAHLAKDATVNPTIQEVKHYYKNKREEFRARPRAAVSKLEGIMEIPIGEARVNPDYLEFRRLREQGKLKPSVIWSEWKNLTPEDRKKILAA